MTPEERHGRLARFIAGSLRLPHLEPEMIRFLSSLFVALALFASPLAMTSGAGMAMSSPTATAAPAGGNHCAAGDPASDQGDAPRELSCASACPAFLPAGAAASDEAPAALAILTRFRHPLLMGIHPEGETPPPRMAPEI